MFLSEIYLQSLDEKQRENCSLKDLIFLLKKGFCRLPSVISTLKWKYQMIPSKGTISFGKIEFIF